MINLILNCVNAITAWNDGIIRAFTPQTGQMIFAILDAHLNAVSAVAITEDGKKLISGGNDGQVTIIFYLLFIKKS